MHKPNPVNKAYGEALWFYLTNFWTQQEKLAPESFKDIFESSPMSTNWAWPFMGKVENFYLVRPLSVPATVLDWCAQMNILSPNSNTGKNPEYYSYCSI